MIINLDELNTEEYIDINYDVLKDDDLDKRIYDLVDAKVEGVVRENSNSDIHLECIFNGNMIIDDSITLEKVSYPFRINIEGTIDELTEIYEDCYDFSKNTLDLKQILWQNIVLEVPISFTICDDAKIKGNGWELIDENNKVDDVDPRLKKLEDLLKGDD